MTAKDDEQRLPLVSGESVSKDGSPRLARGLSAAEVRRAVATSLAVCSFYIVVSASMVFVNKALTYTYHFRATNTLLLMQMIFTIVLLRSARALGVVDFVAFERSRAVQVAPVSLFYSLNAAVALVALRELSVPSYTLIKRLSPMFTLGLEYALLGRRTTVPIVISLAIMVSGTVLAANADRTSSLSAWMLGFVSCVFQALYLTFVKRSGVETGMSSLGVLYYHSILSLPFISLIILAVGEVKEVMSYEHWSSGPFLVVLVFSLTMGLILNYALFLCTEFTSPTSTVVAGQVKAMGQTVIGTFTFGGVDMSGRYLLGTLLNISGGCGYVFSKYKALKSGGGVR